MMASKTYTVAQYRTMEAIIASGDIGEKMRLEIAKMLKQAADAMEREKKYEYSVKYTHLKSGVSFVSTEKFDYKDDANARALNENECQVRIVRREVGEWEEVRDGE